MMDSQNQKVMIVACTGGAWETVHGVLRYKPVGLPRRILQLPLKLTYSELITCVARKLNLSLQTSFRMTYQFPISSSNRNKNVVVDIADDEDVEIFMDMVLKSLNGLITLYVVESGQGRREEYSGTGNNEGKQNVYTYQHLFPEHKTAHVAGTSENPTQVLDSEDDYGDQRDQKVSSYAPMPEKGAAGNVAGNDISWLMSPPIPPPPDIIRAPVSCKLEKGADGEVGKDKSLWWMHSGPPPPPTPAPDKAARKDILWWMNPLPPPSPPPGFTPKAPEKGVDRRSGKDIFWGMPPLLPDPGPCRNPKTYKVFDNKEALKLALRLKCLEEGFKIKTTRSTKDRYEVRCALETCDWRVSATRIQDTDMFQVKSFKAQHKCSTKI